MGGRGEGQGLAKWPGLGVVVEAGGGASTREWGEWLD